MFFTNKNNKIIKTIMDYYDGKAQSIPYSVNDINNALEYTKKNRSEYPDEIIEKLIMIKVMLKNE